MHTIPLIDYSTLHAAITFYKERGYEEISVPWIISYEAYEATKPAFAQDFFTLDGYLNASGEQSFINCMLEGKQIKKHLCVTPCFRKEKVLDELHHLYFMKVELITTDVSLENLQGMIRDAVEFFSQFTLIKVIQMDDEGKAFDIVDEKNNFELGSYGIRSYKNFSWIYGTGVALPRLATVLQK